MDNSVATTAMFPPNDQVEDWSNIGVAKIMSDEAEYGYLGTGFVVGPHTIATAAHVVYERTTNSTYHINEILLFDENGNEESFTPVEIHTPYNYITNNDVSDFDFDYSLITVEENLNDYMSFNLGAITDNAVNKFTITTVGFPGYYYPDETIINNGQDHIKYSSQGSITAIDQRGYYFSHNADTVGGNSGSPIYLVETVNGNTYNTVIGIHVGIYNTGLRFTPHVLKFLSGNTNIQY
jgi:V8-like Glu-specific endopeptidase